MKPFKAKISLIKNSRGCYILDTVKGCSIVNTLEGGCYHDCYAFNIAKRYKLDFGRTVKRGFEMDYGQPPLFGFEDSAHLNETIRAIRKADMPFIRIGEMGDPSWDWRHTFAVMEQIKPAGKPIVIITKHWTPIPDDLLPELAGVCVNTSVSALDADGDRIYRLEQYNRLESHCKSVLRIVSCNFNPENHEGQERAWVQNELFKNENVLDTVFRPSPKNPFLERGVILAAKTKFMKSMVLASVHNPKTYLGHCGTCPEMCGVTL